MMLLLIAFRNLFRNARRTLAVIFTVAFGTGALFCFDGFNTGILNQYRDNTIHSRYGHGQINTKGYREKVYEKPWEHWITNWTEMRDFLEKQPGVDFVFPRVTFFALLTNGNITVSGLGQGINAPDEAQFFNTLNIISGETLTHQEDGVMIGSGLARSLDIQPGDRVTVLANTIYGTINGIDLQVTGIFHTGTQEFDDRIFRLPLKQALTLLDTDRIESVSLGLKSLEAWDPVAQALERSFPTMSATPFAILDEVYYQHSVDWLHAQFRVIQIIILIIVLLGIFNSVSTAILERKQEIGNLRANGESMGDIMRLLAAEGAMLGVIGSIAGLGFSLLINNTVLRPGILMPPAPGLTRQYQVFIELQPETAIYTFILGIATALVATLVAGIRVARMPIGEALRSN
jgi:putative ABC transport system permease protein